MEDNVHAHLWRPGEDETPVPLQERRDPKIWTARMLNATDAVLECPECSNGLIVHAQTWLDGGTPEEGSRSTRVCPYCGLESLVIIPSR